MVVEGAKIAYLIRYQNTENRCQNHRQNSDSLCFVGAQLVDCVVFFAPFFVGVSDVNQKTETE